MKRTLCLFLALILAVGICFSAPVTITASAAEAVSGNCGASTNTGGESSVTWAYDSATTTLTISGSGAMADYATVPWKNLKNEITTVVIGSGVTAIGKSAFRDCTSLTSVEISGGVKSIGGSAFRNCTSLTSVEIPFGVTEIGTYVFSGCTALTSVTIPSSVTSIGNYVFDKCTSLTEVIIPSSVTSIGESAFAGCTSLAEVTIPASVTSINKSAFNGCSALASITVADDNISYSSSEDGVLFDKDKTQLIIYPFGKKSKNYTVPDTVTSIADRAFYGCTSLAEVTISSSVTSIGNSAFYGCTSLASVTIPESVATIGESAFSGCTALISVTIPASVTTIGTQAFYGCTALASVTIPSNVKSIGESTFEGCTSLAEVTIPSSVTRIDNSAFCDCASLTEVTIPSSVTSIGDYAFSDCTALISVTIPASVTSIGKSAFNGCSALASIIVDDNNINYSSSEDGVLFDKYKNRLIVYPVAKTSETYNIPSSVDKIEFRAFSGCKNLKSITIPSSVDHIDMDAFCGCENLKSITIPGSVMGICNDAFNGCKSLTTVTISNGVKEIGPKAFKNCTALTLVTIPASVTIIDDNAFYGCSSSLLFLATEGSVAETYAQENSIDYVTSGSGELEKINFAPIREDENDENSKIIAYSVANCDWSISGELKIPATYNGNPVTAIGKNAFENCAKLTSLEIPDSITTIGDEPFWYAGAIEKITVDDDNKFYSSTDGILFNEENTELICYPSAKEGESYKIPDTVESISQAAFYACSNLKSIVIPDNVTTINEKTFECCSSLESITIPSGVKSIGDNAFHICRSLESVTIPNGVTSIGFYAFAGCSELKTVTILSETVSIDFDAFNECHESLRFFVVDGSEVENSMATDGKCLSFTLNDDGESYSVTDCGRLISGELIIPSEFNGKPVTGIGEEAFYDCTYLTSVTIPERVTTIGGSAFRDCTELESVTIGDNVEEIGEYAFSNCEKLTSVTIPDSVTAIGEYAFFHCEKLTSVTIPKNVTTIGTCAFDGCAALTSINVDGANTKYLSVDGVLFNKDKTELIYYPLGKTETSYTVPESVTTIGEYAFKDCTALTSVTIGKGVTDIDVSAFSGCENMTLTVVLGSYAHQFAKTNNIPYIFKDYSEAESEQIKKLTFTLNADSESYSVTGCDKEISGELKIPATYNGKPVTSIGMHAFSICTSLETVTIGNSVTSIGDYAFSGCEALASVTIGEGVTTIGNYTFNACTALATVTIPDSVTTIGNYTFNACTALATVKIGKKVSTIGGSAFNGCENMTLTVVLGSYAHQFAKTNNIPYIFKDYSEAESEQIKKLTFKEILNDNDEVIAYSVTDCDASIAGVFTIPDKFNEKAVTEIGNGAFASCFNLTSVIIPDSVVSLGEEAFYFCDRLETVTLSSNITVIPNSAFAYCHSLKTLPITENITSIGECAFYDSGEHGSVSLSGVTIGTDAFRSCGITELTLVRCKLNDASVFINNNIEELTISETDIPDGMFKIHSYLKTLVAENSVLGSKSFNGCPSLKSVTVSGGKIANYAFQSSYSLETVTIKNIVSVGEYAFNNCQALKTVEVNAKKISESAFAQCTSLKNVKLGDNVEIIGTAAFEACRELTEIVIPKSVTTIGEEALIGCSDLKYIFFEGTEDAQKTIGDALETNAKIHYGSSTHTFNENYTVDVEPTCTEKGSESQHCKYCDLTQNERPVKENGHTSVNGGTEGAHTICSVCKEPLSTTHNLTSKITTAPTCTEEGVETFTCECGYTYTKPVAKLGHDIVIDKAVAATCTKTGLTEGSHCTRCNGATKAQQAVAATGHKPVVIGAKSATCSQEGYTGDTQCSVCKASISTGTKVAKLAHKLTLVGKKAATFETEGHTGAEVCSVCKQTINAGSVIKKLTFTTPVVTAVATKTGIKVTWNKVENAQSYIVYKRVYNESTEKWSGWEIINANATSTSLDDSNVTLGTKYRYTVRAKNGNTLSPYKSTGTVKYNVIPTVKVANATGGIKVSWSTAANATGYRVYRSTLSNGKWSGWKNMGTAKANKTAWTDKSVKTGVTYKYTVRAVYNKVLSSYNKDGAVSLFLSTPAVKIANTATGIQVKWNSVSGATGYIVYSAQFDPVTNKWSGWANRGTVTTTSWTDTTVKSGVTYKYTVRALNGNTLSAYKGTGGLIYLVQPTVKISNSSKGIKVSWSQCDGATGYTVYRSEFNTETKKWSGWKNRGTAAATKSYWVDKKVTSGKTYKYTVRAVNTSFKSSFVSTSGLLYLAQPTVTVKAVDNGINVAWTQHSGATGYRVYRSELVNGEWSKWKSMGTAKVNKNNWTDKSAEKGKTYKYTVRTVNGKTLSSYADGIAVSR